MDLVVKGSKPLVDKRKDPNFMQVTGHVPKDLARRFKGFCVAQGITIAEALEEAIGNWLKDQGELPQPDASSDLLTHWALTELSEKSGISIKRLEEIRQGDHFKAKELEKLARVLKTTPPEVKRMIQGKECDDRENCHAN